jgi:cytochrome c-type biogenesis protein CcmF
VTVRTGDRFAARDPFGHEWVFVSQGISEFEALNRQVTALALEPTRDGKRMPLITTERRQHVDSRGVPTFEPSTEVGLLEGHMQDVYVVLAGRTGEDTAEVRISFNPLVWWVWYGGIIMAIGGLIVMWPQADRTRSQSGYVAVLEPQPEVAGAGV